MVDEADRACVQKCLKGEVNAFGILVERYQKPIFNTIYRMVHNWDEAEELTQRAFVKAYENLTSFHLRQKFFSWLYRIAINETLNFLKQKKRLEPLQNGLMAKEKNPEEEYRSVELSENLHRALETLDPALQILIVLKHFQGYSYQQMSEFLEVPTKTIKSRLYTARQQLKEALEKMGYLHD